jgi:2-desacetyl-2-hydroxyethyl bacteriochlorophyllide A dehydrogenase
MVRIAVAYVGLCGTDLHVFHGAMDHRVPPRAVLGHEMSGTIAAVGDGVSTWQAGDAVTVMPLGWDGTCAACRAGHQHICQNLVFVGIDAAGALQSLWDVDASLLIPLGGGIDLKAAALVEPVAVAAHDIRRGRVAAGEKVVVLGAGPIGTLIAILAREAGADVVVSEPDPKRARQAAELGLTVVGVPQLAGSVEVWTDHAGADVVFEVSGAAPALASAASLARPRGRIVIVAIHTEPRAFDFHRVFWRELEVVGARVYERQDFARAVDLVRRRDIPTDALITAVYPLAEVNEAFAALAAGGQMKVLIAVGGGASPGRDKGVRA